MEVARMGESAMVWQGLAGLHIEKPNTVAPMQLLDSGAGLHSGDPDLTARCIAQQHLVRFLQF
jgi:hypothetical protein